MTFDRAEYLNNSGFGGCNGFQNDCCENKLVRKELNYVETYIKNTGCGFFNDWGNCCAPCCPPCPPCAPCCPPCPPCPPCEPCCIPCPIITPPCVTIKPPCIDFCNPCIEFRNPCVKDKKVKKIKKDKEDNGPCNPFCKPCYKPKCRDPCKKFKNCDCKICKKSYDKIYGN